MFIAYYDAITMMALAVIGIFSLSARRRAGERSSWPTWLLVPIALFLVLQMCFRMSDPLWFFEFGMFIVVLSRWLVALIRRERSYGWAFYLVLLIVAEEAAEYFS